MVETCVPAGTHDIVLVIVECSWKAKGDDIMKTNGFSSIPTLAAKGLWAVIRITAKLCFAAVVVTVLLFIKIVDDIYIATYPK